MDRRHQDLDLRAAYLDCVDAATPLVTSQEVAAAWTSPSALQGMTVGELTGHLLRAVTTTVAALDSDADSDAALTAAEYFAAAIPTADPEADVNVAIRQRAASEAADGPGSVAQRWLAGAAWLHDNLASHPPTRLVKVFRGMVLPLDEYLVTRLVELVVHVDDLTVSTSLEQPPLELATTSIVISTLVEVARLRHGDLAVVRALARRERDDRQAMRVL